MKISSLKDLTKLKHEGLRLLYPEKIKIRTGLTTCARASGAEQLHNFIKKYIEAEGLNWLSAETGCIGFCQKEPIIEVFMPDYSKLLYANMNLEKTKSLLDSLKAGKIYTKFILCQKEYDYNLIADKKIDLLKGKKAELKGLPLFEEVAFFSKQKRNILRNCGLIDPGSIREYIALGGYFSLYKSFHEYQPQEIINEVKQAKLRGRGGAGFYTGIKWELCRQARGEKKFIICNADEGDPGAYMDRNILESDPFSIIEGMTIGGYAIGAHQGYIYVRAEYPLAIKKLENAIKLAREHGLLGRDIMNSGFDFEIKIVKGSGAFVCGEETALIASIEGRPGEPTQRPPYPAEKGVQGYPTNINNVKTWANIPLIVARGSSWFTKLGTEKSKGTMIFSLVGKVKNTGLVEVPLGIKIRDIIYDIGEGIFNDKKFKAVQTGGPSGGCIPSALIDLAVDYEELSAAGSMMGSGGMVVMDEDTCMVDVAKYFLKFTCDESCGKCIPCREGTRRMLEILEDITSGNGREEDIELLENMGKTIIDSSLCGLGGTAPNPVLSTIRYFRDSYEEHIKNKKCSAGVCKDLLTYSIDPENCSGCGLCLLECPQKAIIGEKKARHSIKKELCTKCGICLEACKFGAIEVQ